MVNEEVCGIKSGTYQIKESGFKKRRSSIGNNNDIMNLSM